MRARAAILIALMVTGAGRPAPAAATATDRWEKSYPIARRAALHLRTDEGHVRVRPWDRREIAVRVSTIGWRIGERGVRIQERRTGDRVELEVRTPRIEVYFGIVVRSLTIEVWVPREADLALESDDGDVGLAAVRGQISVRSGDGRIALDGAGGRLSLRSGDGRIEGTGLDGTLEAGTSDGGIRVAGRFDALVLSSRDGGIVAEVEPGSRLTSAWSLSTGDGRLRLQVPGDLEADLEAHTGDGVIDLDLPLTLTAPVSRQDVRGTLNGGGPPLRLRSRDGSIRVAAR